MAASPLISALVGGQTGGISPFLTDPAIASAMPDIQLGQGLEQQGLSTAPAYPTQALARLAQTLAGQSLVKGGISNLANAYGNSADDMSKIFPAGTPIGDGLRSNNIIVKMTAMQEAGKAMLIGQQGYTLGPNQTRGVGATTINRGSPALAGETAEAEAKAKAPYESGGEGVVNTPEGPKKIPITALTRAQMQPGATGPAPQIPPPPSPEGTKSDARVPAGTAIPGQQAPQPGVTGAPLENPAIEPAVKADTEELAKDREAALKGQGDMANVRMIQDFLPKVRTGWSAETKLEGARILKALGVPNSAYNDFLQTDVAAGQILQKKFVELSAAAARTMGAREPGSVIQMFSKAYPNLGTDPQAVQLQTNALYMDRLRAQELAQQKTTYLNHSINSVQSTGQYRGLSGFNEQFNKNNPPEYYLHAAEAMSGVPEPWKRITDPNQRQQIINLIPSGSKFMAPDQSGVMRMYVKP